MIKREERDAYMEYVYNKMDTVYSFKNWYEQTYGITPSDQELNDEMGVTGEDIFIENFPVIVSHLSGRNGT